MQKEDQTESAQPAQMSSSKREQKSSSEMSILKTHRSRSRKSHHQNILHFPRTDVTNYVDVVALFDLALKQHGRVDVAVSNA